MHRPTRAHRLILSHALLFFPLIVGLFGFVLYLHHSRIFSLAHNQRLNLQQIISRTAREIPPDRITDCIGHILAPENRDTGWTLFWIGPGGEIRWASREAPQGQTLQTLLPEKFRESGLPTDPTAFLDALPSEEFYYEQIDPRDPEKGGILLYEPLHTNQLICRNLAFYGIFFLLFFGTSYLLYHYLLRKQIRAVIKASGLPGLIPVPGPGPDINTWARQYAAKASRLIAESRDQFDSLFEILQDGILLIDKDNRIRRVNTAAAKMLGGTPDTLIGHPLSELQDGSLLISFLVDIRSNTSCQSTELLLENQKNQINTAGLRIPAGESGSDSSIILILRDLTRLRQLERAGEEYAVNVSHELKTPLTLIQGFTETLLAHEDMDSESRMQALRTIERHAKRISRIIDDLLRLAWLKNEDYSIGIPRSETSISGIISETVFMCDEWARNAGISIKVDYPENLMWNLNPGLMEEALINLVKNAILYAIIGPVEIRACVNPKGNLELSVVDRGPGLKPQDAQHIFDRFYRVDKGRSRASGGSGLGLPIVQQIVEAHQGTARVETAPGQGCTFILEIPPAV